MSTLFLDFNHEWTPIRALVAFGTPGVPRATMWEHEYPLIIPMQFQHATKSYSCSCALVMASSQSGTFLCAHSQWRAELCGAEQRLSEIAPSFYCTCWRISRTRARWIGLLRAKGGTRCHQRVDKRNGGSAAEYLRLWRSIYHRLRRRRSTKKQGPRELPREFPFYFFLTF
jgi:hypothetical protein